MKELLHSFLKLRTAREAKGDGERSVRIRTVRIRVVVAAVDPRVECHADDVREALTEELFEDLLALLQAREQGFEDAELMRLGVDQARVPVHCAVLLLHGIGDALGSLDIHQADEEGDGCGVFDRLPRSVIER